MSRTASFRENTGSDDAEIDRIIGDSVELKAKFDEILRRFERLEEDITSQRKRGRSIRLSLQRER